MRACCVAFPLHSYVCVSNDATHIITYACACIKGCTSKFLRRAEEIQKNSAIYYFIIYRKIYHEIIFNTLIIKNC